MGDPAGFWEPRISNDDTHVAVAVGQDVADIWIYNLEGEMRKRIGQPRKPFLSESEHIEAQGREPKKALQSSSENAEKRNDAQVGVIASGSRSEQVLRWSGQASFADRL